MEPRLGYNSLDLQIVKKLSPKCTLSRNEGFSGPNHSSSFEKVSIVTTSCSSLSEKSYDAALLGVPISLMRALNIS